MESPTRYRCLGQRFEPEGISPDIRMEPVFRMNMFHKGNHSVTLSAYGPALQIRISIKGSNPDIPIGLALNESVKKEGF